MKLRLVHDRLHAPDFRGGRSRKLELQLVHGARTIRIASLVERSEHSYSDTIDQELVEARLYRLGRHHLLVSVVWEEHVSYVGSSRSLAHYESLDDGETWRPGGATAEADAAEVVHRVSRSEIAAPVDPA